MFVHSWAIAVGAAALGLPVLIHWLTRPRPVRLNLSTIRMVQEIVRQRRARSRIRDWLILLLRSAAVALLALAFARPLFNKKPIVAAEDDDGSAVRVVVVDQSISMGALSGGATLFERARGVAAAHLERSSDRRTNLILGGARPRAVFDAPQSNTDALREELADAAIRTERFNAAAVIHAAGEMLARSGDENAKRQLVIISDFQRSNWASADFSSIPRNTNIQLESVAPAQTGPNVAILGAGVSGRAELGRPGLLEIDIGNYSSAPRTVEVDITLEEATYRLQGKCMPGVKTTLTREIEFPREGWVTGEARLVNLEDSIDVDNSRAVAVLVRPARVYALLTREPADRRPSASYYVDRALAPIEARGGQSAERVVRCDAASPDQSTLASADLIAIVRPGRLNQETVGILAGLLRRGRPLLYVASETADATNLKTLAEAAGSGLSMPVEFAPPSRSRPSGSYYLAEVRESSRPFRAFGDRLNDAVRPLRSIPGLVSRRTENGIPEDILATYSDGSACIVLSRMGDGALAVLNIDLTRSNLPQLPAFVPILGDLAAEMLVKRTARQSITCGESVAAYLPVSVVGTEGLRILGKSDGESSNGELVNDPQGVLWRWPAAGAPGIYRVQRSDETVMAVACGVSGDESDLRVLDASVFQERLAGGRSLGFRTAADTDSGESDQSWWWFAAACTACMLAEMAVLRMTRM